MEHAVDVPVRRDVGDVVDLVEVVGRERLTEELEGPARERSLRLDGVNIEEVVLGGDRPEHLRPARVEDYEDVPVAFIDVLPRLELGD